MRTIIIAITMSLLCLFSHAQNVGIGTTTPIARLHVADSNVVFTGTSPLILNTPYYPPVSGAGIRTMWYPAKAAFRTGMVLGSNWDKDSVGYVSFASGYDTKALGNTSIAMGLGSTAYGNSSIAMGENATASQLFAIAIGRYATASNFSSVSIGEKDTASGPFSVSMGIVTKALGESSVSLGNNTITKARGSFVTGTFNDTLDNPNNGVSASTDRIFQIGNGMDGARSNAITILRNANTGIGTNYPLSKLHIKSTDINPMIIEGGNQMYVTLVENNTNIGYIGSYSGNPTDMELGTYYDNTSGSVILSTNNTPKLTVINNGNVGIGTSTPTYKLHVGNSDNCLRIEGPALAGSGGDALSISGNGNVNVDAPFTPSGRFTIKENGNVGIGVTAPVEKLEVAGKIKTTNLQITAGAANGNILMSDLNGNASWQIPATPTNYWTASGSNIYNNNAGNVGIGTSSPNAPLQFATSNQKRKIVLFETANNDNQYFGFGVFAGELRYQTGVNTNDHVFYTAASSSTSSELMRIKGNGNVGIGVSAPAYKLHIGSSNNSLRVEGPALSGGVALSIGGFGDLQIDLPNSAGGRFIVKDNGNTGIGNAEPASKLEVNGALATKATYYGSGSGNVSLDNSATVWIFAINGYSVSLPDPTACANRRYTIVNKTNAVMACSNFYNMANAVATNIPAYNSIEVIASINTNRWEQIR